MSMQFFFSIILILIVHLGEDVSANRAVLFCYIKKGRPRKVMVEIVLEHVVLGKTPEIAVLDLVEVVEAGSSECWHYGDTDIIYIFSDISIHVKCISLIIIHDFFQHCLNFLFLLIPNQTFNFVLIFLFLQLKLFLINICMVFLVVRVVN